MSSSRLPPNAYCLVNDDGDFLTRPFATLVEVKAALMNFTHHPRYGAPRLVACWAYVHNYYKGGPRLGDVLPVGTMPANYGPDSTDPARAVEFPVK